MSNIIVLANSVKDYLSEVGLDAEVTCSPEYILSGNKQKVVFVTPKNEETKRISRGSFEKKYTIDICFIERIKNDTEISKLIAFMENLNNETLKRTFDKSVVTETSFNPLFASEELRQKHTFVSVLTLTLLKVN